MPSVEELSVTAVRSAMAPGFDQERVATDLVIRARRNITALRMARARVERGAGWRSGPIGQRARDALTLAIDMCTALTRDLDLGHLDEIDLTEVDLRERPDLRHRVDLHAELDHQLDDTLPA
jgi:hypothetical protein